MSKREEDTYDRLGELFLRYINAENEWRVKKSERRYFEVQKCLRAIRREAKLRNSEMNSEMREYNPNFFQRFIDNNNKHKKD